jgi:hypothetical protein
MECRDCSLKCIAQTGRTLYISYKKHIQAIRNNNGNSGYSNHIRNTGHTFERVTDTMEIIKIEKKGKLLNTLGRYHVYKIGKTNYTEWRIY